MTSLRSTITKANDLSARIGHDIGDVCDLIVRKAGEKQRGGRESNKPRPVNK